jgi:hypothetical protein
VVTGSSTDFLRTRIRTAYGHTRLLMRYSD